jgi:hypothetical protein
MEQVAVAHFFGKEKPLPCEDSIFHYWNFKEFRILLEKFFDEHKGQSFEQWSQDIEKISPMQLIQPNSILKNTQVEKGTSENHR